MSKCRDCGFDPCKCDYLKELIDYAKQLNERIKSEQNEQGQKQNKRESNDSQEQIFYT